MKLTKNIIYFSISIFTSFLLGCDGGAEVFNEGTDKECAWDGFCESIEFSLVNNDNYDDNLIGTNGQLVHPDSIVLTNTRKDTMYHTEFFKKGWGYVIENFSVYQELYCFNPCLLDSAFTRTYYMYIGNGDTDTLEVFFPEHTDFPQVFYNGLEGTAEYLNKPPEHGIGWSYYYLRKQLN